MVKQLWQKAAGKHHCYQKTAQSWPAERDTGVRLLWLAAGCSLSSSAHGHCALAPSPRPGSMSTAARHAHAL